MYYLDLLVKKKKAGLEISLLDTIQDRETNSRIYLTSICEISLCLVSGF